MASKSLVLRPAVPIIKTWIPTVNRARIWKRARSVKTPKPYRHTVIEGFIDDYRRVRFILALASLALLGVIFLFGGQETNVILVNALGLSIMAMHAGWSLMTGVRTPRIAIFLDVTVIGAASAIGSRPTGSSSIRRSAASGRASGRCAPPAPRR